MYIELDGAKYYANTGGREHIKGQPYLTFIHGAGMDHSIWALFNRYHASNGYNTLAIDMPGHGKSGGDALTTVEAMADWLCHLLEAAQIEHTSLAGHSLGSLVALETAARRADCTESLTLMGTAVPMPVGEPLLNAAEKGNHTAVDMIMLFGHGYAAQLGGNPVAGVNIVNNNMRLLERALDDLLYTDLNACNLYQNGLNAATGLDVPTTLILGQQDRMTPARAATDLAKALPKCQTRILENCGHMMLAENPEAVHQALCQALL